MLIFQSTWFGKSQLERSSNLRSSNGTTNLLKRFFMLTYWIQEKGIFLFLERKMLPYMYVAFSNVQQQFPLTSNCSLQEMKRRKGLRKSLIKTKKVFIFYRIGNTNFLFIFWIVKFKKYFTIFSWRWRKKTPCLYWFKRRKKDAIPFQVLI